MGEKAAGIDFEALVNAAFDGNYKMNGSAESVAFRFRLLEILGKSADACLPFVASAQEGKGGFYAIRGLFSKRPREDNWFIQFAKEQGQWDPYDSSYFEFNGTVEQTSAGLLVVRNGVAIENRPASLQGNQLIYARHNEGSFVMAQLEAKH